MTKLQDKWFKTAIGRAMNPDKLFGLQCKDVLDDYAQTIFQKTWILVVRPSNAKDVFNRVPDSYWIKIRNNPNDAKQLPKKGDWICYGGARWNGWFGHGGVVESADNSGVTIIQQDGFLRTRAHRRRFGWKFALPIGWVRPRVK